MDRTLLFKNEIDFCGCGEQTPRNASQEHHTNSGRILLSPAEARPFPRSDP
jgi:hypothetical protein